MYVGCLWNVERKNTEKCIISKICHCKFLPPILIFLLFLKREERQCVLIWGSRGDKRKERESQTDKKKNTDIFLRFIRKKCPAIWQCKITENFFPLPHLLHKRLWTADVALSEGVIHQEGREVGATVGSFIHIHDIHNWQLPDFKPANEHPRHT